jgi:hypothetical protein
METEMKPPLAFSLFAAALSPFGILAISAANSSEPKPVSPVYGVSIPDGYREWQFIAPAIEAEPLDELRTVVGNDKAIAAYI